MNLHARIMHLHWACKNDARTPCAIIHHSDGDLYNAIMQQDVQTTSCKQVSLD